MCVRPDSSAFHILIIALALLGWHLHPQASSRSCYRSCRAVCLNLNDLWPKQ